MASAGSLPFIRCSPQRLLRAGEASCYVQRIELRSRVRAVHALSRGAAGHRAISLMLRQSGIDAGRWLVRRLMQDKWCYLAFVADIYSRWIIGSVLSLTADVDLVCRTLRNALETRPCDGRLLFHSDQGVQYKSNQYRKLLWRYWVMKSMSLRGNCLDNLPMERVFLSLKVNGFRKVVMVILAMQFAI